MEAPKRNIYIIDDDEDSRDAMDLMLKSCGGSVRSYAFAQAFINEVDDKNYQMF